jgi:arylsulfatase A-like enzyme
LQSALVETFEMKAHSFFSVASLIVAVGLAGLATASAAEPGKPNIVFILADDAGIGDFSCYGCRYGTTPNIDRVGREGMKFTCAYSGNAVCAPSRCVLMTGLHPGHALYRANADKLFLPAGQLTTARLLHAAGYATGGFGKWGLGRPGTPGAAEKEGFDEFFGYYDQVHAHDYYTDHLIRNGKNVPIPENAGGKKVIYSHNLIADETLKFIERNKNHPFFCYAAWTPPHADYVIPSDAPYTDRDWPQMVKNYAAMVGLVDRDLGRVMQKLKDLGLDDKTLVIFSSDNGANKEFIKPLGSTGDYRGYKRLLYEGGTRTPMLVRWPGHIKAGSTSDILTTFMDFLPTAADLAGVAKPAGIDGLSILPTLLGQEQQAKHESLYFEIYEPYFQQSVRLGDWKGYRLGTKAPLELYDLKLDPKEQHDISAQHPDIVKKLEAILAAEHTPSKRFKSRELPGPQAAQREASLPVGTLQSLLFDDEDG